MHKLEMELLFNIRPKGAVRVAALIGPIFSDDVITS